MVRAAVASGGGELCTCPKCSCRLRLAACQADSLWCGLLCTMIVEYILSLQRWHAGFIPHLPA